MTHNKLPPLPESSDDDLPVPIAYGMRRKGEISVIGVVPNKVHVKPATSETYLREFEEVALFTSEQLHAARSQAFHDGQCEALRQSQSLPAGAVAGLVGKWKEQADAIALRMNEKDEGGETFRWAGWYRDKELAKAAAKIGCADELEQALQADAREKGEAAMPLPHGFSCGGVNVWARDAASIAKVRHWMDQAHAMQAVADELREEVKRLRAATQPAQASEKDMIALVAGPYMYHHKMDDHAMREGKAFDRCRELTIQNIQTHFAMLRAATSSQETASE